MPGRYLACHAADGEWNFDPREFEESAQAEWQSDSRGQGVLEEAAFRHSWFELADVYTKRVDGA